jgi:hypothetical protein
MERHSVESKKLLHIAYLASSSIYFESKVAGECLPVMNDGDGGPGMYLFADLVTPRR